MGLLQLLYRITGISPTNEDAEQRVRAEAQEQAAQATYDHARRTTRLVRYTPGKPTTNPLLTASSTATIDDLVTIHGKVELREGCRIGYGAVILGDSRPDAPPLIIGRNARIGPYCVIRAQDDTVIIGDNASLGPYNVINYNNPLGMPPTGEVRIGKNTRTGSFCIFGNNLRIGDNNQLSNSTRVEYYTTIGDGNRLNGCLLGGDPQDLTFYDELDDLSERRKSGITDGIAIPTYLAIGNDNIIRENVRIHRGTRKSHDSTTRIGSSNLIMDHTHIAHDCEIGDYIIITTGCKFAGHVVLENNVNLAGSVKIAPFVRVGTCAFVAGDCAIAEDLLPFMWARPEDGRTATSIRIPNYRGVRRMLMGLEKHMDEDTLKTLKEELSDLASRVTDRKVYDADVQKELYALHPRGDGWRGFFTDYLVDFALQSAKRSKERKPRVPRDMESW